MHSFEVFQLAKLEEIQIPSKNVEFEILLTQSHTLAVCFHSLPEVTGAKDSGSHGVCAEMVAAYAFV